MPADVEATTVDILTQNGTAGILIQPNALLPPPGTPITVEETTMAQTGVITIPLAGAKTTLLGDKQRHRHLLSLLLLFHGLTTGTTGAIGRLTRTRYVLLAPQCLKTVLTTLV